MIVYGEKHYAFWHIRHEAVGVIASLITPDIKAVELNRFWMTIRSEDIKETRSTHRL